MVVVVVVVAVVGEEGRLGRAVLQRARGSEDLNKERKIKCPYFCGESTLRSLAYR